MTKPMVDDTWDRGGGCFVRFSFSMYVACPCLALFSMVLVCLRVVVDVFEVVVGGC